jgi:hypothetical protein
MLVASATLDLYAVFRVGLGTGGEVPSSFFYLLSFFVFLSGACIYFLFLFIHFAFSKSPFPFLLSSCFSSYFVLEYQLRLENIKKKLHGLSPRVNYTDRATAACRRSDCQLLRIEGAMFLPAWRIPTAVISISRPEPLLFISSSSSVIFTRLSGPHSRPTTSQKSNPDHCICSQELWQLDHRGGL